MKAADTRSGRRRVQASRAAAAEAGRSPDSTNSMAPIIRVSARVRDGNNDHALIPDLIDEMVGESPEEQLPHARPGRPGRAAFWMLASTLHGSVHCVEEFATEPRTLLIVPTNRLGQVSRRRFAEVNSGHRPSISVSIRRLTDSHGSSSAVPAVMAASRRSISLSQAVSARGSAGPERLPNNSAASSARSGISNRRASARTAAVDFVIDRILRPDSAANKRLRPASRWRKITRASAR